MNKKTTDIQDDELRVIGGKRPASTGEQHRKFRSRIAVAVTVAVLVIVGGVVIRKHTGTSTDVPTVFEPLAQDVHPYGQRIGNYSDTLTAWTEHLKFTINDIELSVYIPHNAEPVLQVGAPSQEDTDIILSAQAADIRADNGKINGAFVLGGKPLAWGLSKKGYVAIINSQISVGVSDNSPLFEEATAQGGYFFRQYALVDNGVLIENAPKGKSIRKAICERNSEILVIVSETPESFHDFAQTLIDFGVNNAVYLVGGYTFGFYRDSTGTATLLSEVDRTQVYKYENYITWRKK